eukprot:CAMPEP_0195074250 /NCGR_PEP_ID=MMETSP0448-20130528/17403_1 /TAXON_ID=66468 /ORGANISM="Heterocapsa triquestra, Strain CCMP 448" /LENGTH=144 /DNA_ID=CAMNT_0040106477 /DNA_START=48 /DNA_END=479 /DNA_ORIENTATION=-
MNIMGGLGGVPLATLAARGSLTLAPTHAQKPFGQIWPQLCTVGTSICVTSSLLNGLKDDDAEGTTHCRPTCGPRDAARSFDAKTHPGTVQSEDFPFFAARWGGPRPAFPASWGSTATAWNLASDSRAPPAPAAGLRRRARLLAA